MTRLWKWLERNSTQLQGLAAVAAIVAALAAVPFLMWRWLQPELTITVSADSPTMPPALEEWISAATLEIKTLPRSSEGDPDPYRFLLGLQSTGPLDPIRDGSSGRVSRLSRLRVDVANQATRAIPGVRLRLERAYPDWGVTLTANFLTAEELTVWQKAAAAQGAGPALVLPELPPLPPQGVVTIVTYGDVADAHVSATVPGASFKRISTVRVEDKGLIALILRPYWVPLVLGLAFSAIMAGLAIFEKRVWRRAERFVTYNLACSEAKAGRSESALALLQRAVEAGYSNLQHMRSDPDLEQLRTTDAFKKRFGS